MVEAKGLPSALRFLAVPFFADFVRRVVREVRGRAVAYCVFHFLRNFMLLLRYEPYDVWARLVVLVLARNGLRKFKFRGRVDMLLWVLSALRVLRERAVGANLCEVDKVDGPAVNGDGEFGRFRAAVVLVIRLVWVSEVDLSSVGAALWERELELVTDVWRTWEGTWW